MATEAYSNYASTLTFAGAEVGKCLIVDFPELNTPRINTTNHASGGWSEAIPSGLINVGDITLSVIVTDTVLAAIRTAMLARTIDEIIVGDVVETITADGFYVSAKKEAADAQSPDVIKATIVMAFTGPVVIAPVVP